MLKVFGSDRTGRPLHTLRDRKWGSPWVGQSSAVGMSCGPRFAIALLLAVAACSGGSTGSNGIGSATTVTAALTGTAATGDRSLAR